jgi:hypothetical protein
MLPRLSPEPGAECDGAVVAERVPMAGAAVGGRDGIVLVAVCEVAAGAGAIATEGLVAVTVRVATGVVFVRATEVESVALIIAPDAAEFAIALGESVSTTDAGSDASPIGWLKSRLAAQVTPAVIAIPSNAAHDHRNGPRLTHRNLAVSRLSDRKAPARWLDPASFGLLQTQGRNRPAAGTVDKCDVAAPLARELARNRQPEASSRTA